MTFARGTEVSVEKSRAEIEKLITRYGATSTAFMSSPGRAMIAFEAKDRKILFELPLPDKNEKRFLRDGRGYLRPTSTALKAWEQGCRERWRALCLVIKAKLEAVESGISTFEQEFYAHIMLPNGRTVYEATKDRVAEAYVNQSDVPLLPYLPTPPQRRLTVQDNEIRILIEHLEDLAGERDIANERRKEAVEARERLSEAYDEVARTSIQQAAQIAMQENTIEAYKKEIDARDVLIVKLRGFEERSSIQERSIYTLQETIDALRENDAAYAKRIDEITNVLQAIVKDGKMLIGLSPRERSISVRNLKYSLTILLSRAEKILNDHIPF